MFTFFLQAHAKAFPDVAQAWACIPGGGIGKLGSC